MTTKAKVQVFLKAGVLDVQGKAVEAALHGLGWPDVGNVRVGRLIEFLTALGQDVQITVKPTRKVTGEMSVVSR